MASLRSQKQTFPSRLAERAELSDPILRAIGSVISEWAKVEQSLYIAVAYTFGGMPGQEVGDNHALAMLLGSGMDNRTMAGLLRGIIQGTFPNSADEFGRLVDRILDEGKRRNVIAHAVWRKGSRPASVQTFAIRAVGEIRYDKHDFTAAEMERLAARIKKVRREFVSFMNRHGYFRALHGRPPQQAP